MLDEGELRYYVDIDRADLKGTFRLSLSTEVSISDRRDHTLLLKDGEEELLVDFDTAEDQREWRHALETVRCTRADLARVPLTHPPLAHGDRTRVSVGRPWDYRCTPCYTIHCRQQPSGGVPTPRRPRAPSLRRAAVSLARLGRRSPATHRRPHIGAAVQVSGAAPAVILPLSCVALKYFDSGCVGKLTISKDHELAGWCLWTRRSLVNSCG